MKKVKNKNIIILGIFVGVLAITTTVFSILYAINKTNYENTSVNLENIYQRSFYDLVDNINNTEVKLNKLLSSSDKKYNKKLLSEIHENSKDAQYNLSYLPISINGMAETVGFINQINGYTATLVKKDEDLKDEDIKTLNRLSVSLSEIKTKLNDISRDVSKGYNISINSKDMKTDYTKFTSLMKGTKTTDLDYPTMIYDGPFSDTVVDKEIKGLNFEEISEDKAKEIASNLYQNSKVSKAGDTKGRFSTYDYNITLSNGIDCYSQITKKGGKLLTLSAYSDGDRINCTKKEAIDLAIKFAEDQGLDLECVWSDIVGNDAYINLSPVVNDIIYYPDLIKVKVDLSSSQVIGWEAVTYYTNHIDRSLPKVLITEADAEKTITDGYFIEETRLALSPIEDYNEEILTYEIKCKKDGSDYYFYVDVQSGELVNILKVIETDNGNLLM